MTGPARRMVVSSHPWATEAAYDVLGRGGSVVDAAVAAAALLTVVDPRSTGVAGDLFAQVWLTGEPGPVGLAAAGISPAGMTLEALTAAGMTTMPRYGPWSVTVPGAVRGWQALLDRYGRVHRSVVLERAIRVAGEGFPVTPRVAREWAASARRLATNDAAAAVFLPGGRPPAAGEYWANPALGGLLRHLADHGLAAFYEDPVAGRIADAVAGLGGPMRSADILGWDGVEWVTPLSIDHDGITVHELPPPGQGLVVLAALGVYQRLSRSSAADGTHAAIEALKYGFAVARNQVADPRLATVDIDAALSPEALAAAAAAVDGAAPARATIDRGSDTVYLAVADVDQGACSLIQSVYEGFGSAVGVPGLGITLQNRAADFEVDPAHPNCIGPAKRPYHTIIPAMLSRDGRFAGCLGCVGGYMQPQGQLQVLRNVTELGMTPQEAVDAPRFRVYSGLKVGIEAGFDPQLADELRSRGHDVTVVDGDQMGGAQLILTTPGGLLGGSDQRKDGLVDLSAGVPPKRNAR